MINEVLDVMVGLAQEGMTMMVVTHEMGFAKKVANRVVFMDQGRILEDCGKDDFFGAPRSERARDFLERMVRSFVMKNVQRDRIAVATCSASMNLICWRARSCAAVSKIGASCGNTDRKSLARKNRFTSATSLLSLAR